MSNKTNTTKTNKAVKTTKVETKKETKKANTGFNVKKDFVRKNFVAKKLGRADAVRALLLKFKGMAKNYAKTLVYWYMREEKWAA